MRRLVDTAGSDRIAIAETKEVLLEVLSTCELHRPDKRPEAPRGRTVAMTPKRGARLELRNRVKRASHLTEAGS